MLRFVHEHPWETSEKHLLTYISGEVVKGDGTVGALVQGNTRISVVPDYVVPDVGSITRTVEHNTCSQHGQAEYETPYVGTFRST